MLKKLDAPTRAALANANINVISNYIKVISNNIESYQTYIKIYQNNIE